ncbi:MAG: class I mannose-6-phosphate isomerase [Alphaproteobacteria bacterium]|nr:class I mannose-6-phosphate isomerase [Alphaproteobacteria bacterium]MBV8406104.1 class I mannose-6-phosphate isomerase [Alphaproteobacteria bacterium]
MPTYRLEAKQVHKPWGRHDLWQGFDDAPFGLPRVGEVWFQSPRDVGHDNPELLIKYLFTSEKLSIQVHPGDGSARARGHERGKSEAWYILCAEPDATIAIGTLKPMTKEELRAASLAGSLVDLLDWRAVQANQFWYVPAGTLHALGGGLVVVEIQQNVDVTYRLYDYGSDRELHLEDGVAVANPIPYVAPFKPRELWPGRRILAAGCAFVVEHWTFATSGILEATRERPVWLIPLKGGATFDGQRIEPGSVWLSDSVSIVDVREEIDLLACYAGGAVKDSVWRRTTAGRLP